MRKGPAGLFALAAEREPEEAESGAESEDEDEEDKERPEKVSSFTRSICGRVQDGLPRWRRTWITAMPPIRYPVVRIGMRSAAFAAAEEHDGG